MYSRPVGTEGDLSKALDDTDKLEALMDEIEGEEQSDSGYMVRARARSRIQELVEEARKEGKIKPCAVCTSCEEERPDPSSTVNSFNP